MAKNKPEWALRDSWYSHCQCGGHKWFATTYWQGDADWAVYRCDKCDEETHTAGCWSHIVKPKPTGTPTGE